MDTYIIRGGYPTNTPFPSLIHEKTTRRFSRVQVSERAWRRWKRWRKSIKRRDESEGVYEWVSTHSTLGTKQRVIEVKDAVKEEKRAPQGWRLSEVRGGRSEATMKREGGRRGRHGDEQRRRRRRRRRRRNTRYDLTVLEPEGHLFRKTCTSKSEKTNKVGKRARGKRYEKNECRGCHGARKGEIESEGKQERR